jgi:hypothetical protein
MASRSGTQPLIRAGIDRTFRHLKVRTPRSSDTASTVLVSKPDSDVVALVVDGALFGKWRSLRFGKTWLTMFLGPLKPRNNGKLSGTLSSFDQTEFEASPTFR